MTDWKINDLALITGHRGDTYVGMYATQCLLGCAAAPRPHWHASGGAMLVAHYEARPLLVVDPEDREQVEAILRKYHDWQWPGAQHEASINDMQATLRHLAQPEPEVLDPLGLGAVVRAGCQCDSVPHLFVRDPYSTIFDAHIDRKIMEDNKVWKATCGHHAWDQLVDPVVLQEGRIPDE